MNELQATNDLLKIIRQHAFHNPLQPRACQICHVEQYRQENTPTVRWSKAVERAVKPPMPVAIMLLAILGLITALALTMNT